MHSDHAAKIHVTTTDLIAVQRVIVLLTGRGYVLTRLEAEEAGAGRWRIGLDLTAGPGQLELLLARLQRLPSVLVVSARLGDVLAATA
jgi:acetolactate synthase regulatory subunit